MSIFSLAAASALTGLYAPGALAKPTAASVTPAPDITLDYDKFRLENGLTVIVHEDRKAPVVAVSVWYKVGSKDEPPGKTGFAHLFEHLMFSGSENVPNWDYPLDEVGQTDANGTTWFDRTNYFQTVPSTAVERVLFMESDRMGHLLGSVTQENLDVQRGVVQNEKRQGDNSPYGRVEYAVLEGLLPAGHPYSHSAIGSMEDLDAASLEIVKDWFETYYGAANAVLVLAGDIDAATARPMVEKYFGDIPAGPPLTKTVSDAPKLETSIHEMMSDRVPQIRLDRYWVAPGRAQKDLILLDLAAEVLGGGKTSRLYQELVYKTEVATSATASVEPQELMSFYSVTVDLADGQERGPVQASMAAVISDFLKTGPTKEELARAKTSMKAGILRGLEKVGGFGGKAVTLAQGELYADDPGFIIKQLEWIESATPEEVIAVARDVMSAGHYQLDIMPFPEYATVASDVDRSAGVPAVDTTPDLTFPTVEEATLSNGMKVVLANRPAVPIVEVSLQFDAGYAADSVEGGILGAASFTGAMLDEGTKTKSALQIAEQLEGLGARLSTGSTLDTTGVSMSALKENLKPSLDLLADIVRNPAFSDEEIEKLRTRWIAGIQQEKANPVQLAQRLLPAEIYGKDHAYGVPFTGSGTESSIASLTKSDLVRFKDTWLRPDNVTIFVVGDATLADVTPTLEAAFGSWKAPAQTIPQKNIAFVDLPASSRVIIVDKPDAPQTLLLAAHLAPPTSAPDNIAVSTMNDILGGQFTARVNMNLREEKHWAYGAYTYMQGARGQRPFFVYAPVQTDKTKDSITELLKELNGIKADKPATSEELERTVLSNVRSLPGSYETSDDVMDSLTSSARFGRPWDYPTSVKDQYEALTLADIEAAAGEVVHPESLVWLIVGDVSEIEADIRSLNLGEVEVRKLADD